MTHVKLFTPILMLVLSSCSFYYKTSDIQNKLNASNENVRTNVDKLTQQINTYQSEYKSLQCNLQNEEFKEAARLFSEVNTSLNELSGYKKKVSDAYNDFVIYTKGKDKIQSGTPEWKKFKVTKKQFKTDLKSIESIGKTTVSNAENLNKHVTENVVPKIQKCVVADYSKSFKTAVDSLNAFQKKLPSQIKSYSNQVAGITKMFLATQPDKCKELTDEMAKLNDVSKELSLITKKVQSLQDEFNKSTKGVEFIYSCSSNWDVVMNAESNLKLEQQHLNELNAKIQQIQGQMQNVINSLKQ